MLAARTRTRLCGIIAIRSCAVIRGAYSRERRSARFRFGSCYAEPFRECITVFTVSVGAAVRALLLRPNRGAVADDACGGQYPLTLPGWSAMRAFSQARE